MIKEIEKKRDDTIWMINAWKDFQIQSINVQVEALLMQAENDMKVSIKIDLNILIFLILL